MSRTVRNRKQGINLFANSYTKRNCRQQPLQSWDDLKYVYADGRGNFWLTNLTKYERKQANKQERKQGKQVLTKAVKNVSEQSLESVQSYSPKRLAFR